MINPDDYFEPVSIDKPLWQNLSDHSCLSHNLTINTESNPLARIDGFKLAIIGVPDDRRSPNKGCGSAPDRIRENLYMLSRLSGKSGIADLGNLKKGISFEDTLAALKDVLAFLQENGTMALILGGSSALVTAIDKVLSDREKSYNYLTVDSRIDFINEKKEKDSFNYLGDLIYNKKTTLYNFTVVGYQSYLNDLQVINRFRKLNFDLLRIGEVRDAIQETEPVFRDSHLVTFDISAVRLSDAPGTFAPSPNGFYSEEICLLARYAGLSDNLRIFSLLEVNPLLDNRNQTCALAAQIIWFFLDSFTQKQNESLILGRDNSGRFVKYHVSVKDMDEDLIFIKSTITNRWWIELCEKGKTSYIACSYRDYLRANENEVPQRWMRAIARS